MALLTKLKETFLPSASTSAARRKKVFGTESKAVAATAIVAGAALAIGAGTAAAAAGAGAAIKSAAPKVAAAVVPAATKVAKTAAKYPKTTAAVAVGASFVAGSKEISVKDVATTGAKAVKQTASIPYELGGAYDVYKKEGSVAGLKAAGEAIKDNPLGAAILGTAALGATGAAAYAGAKVISGALSSAKEVEIKYPGSIAEVPALAKTTQETISQAKPLEPELVDVSRKVSTQRRKALSKSKTPSFAPSVRVNIYNQTKTANFIKKLAY